MNAQTPLDESLIYSTTRPDSKLLTQYFIWSLATLIFFPIAIIPLFFKYHTLRYRFDSEGLSMSWGILFRREINLTYSRIQDIHVSRGIVERWLGLGSVAIQTASGSSSAEMVIQGLTIYAELRDFLYRRMRGHRAEGLYHPSSPRAEAGSDSETLQLLQQIHSDLKAVRHALESRTDATEERPEA